MSWAFAKIVCLHLPLLDSISAAAINRITSLLPLHITNIVWAFAKLTLQHQPLIDALAGESIPKIRAFTHQNLANTVWAIATLNYSLTTKMVPFIVEVIDKVHEFSC